ncbi:TonB-dependent siderophore receptor [Nodosilinea sp. AN01ver1]|uniref:TonB-dependent siderophore receptor n=1 Tax=Nodosilinea sp. AN01ver1 TaxID=3423362 RepID=UPI003D32413C
MTVRWMRWGPWSLQVAVGLGLLVGQGAAASEVRPETTAEPRLDSPATTGDEWRQQIAQANPVAITDLQLEATEAGLTLRLETDGELAVPEPAIVGNAAIADIPNAVLRLPEGEFLASAPAAGIALVNVTSLPDNQVRIAITGTEAPPAVTINAGATGLVLSAIPGAPAAQAPDDAIQITVTGDTDEEDYFVPSTSTATRTDTPILEVPAAIQVIPRQVLEDQQATNLGDALRNTSGAAVNSGEGRGFQIDLRGFQGVPVFRDGFRVYSPKGKDVRTTVDIANVERIEVLRGPASALFGQIEPGGIVNVVSRRPQATPAYRVGLQAGSYGFLRPQVDLTGPLTEDENLLYRLVATYQREDGFRNFEEDVDRVFVAPSLTWRISDRTDLNLQLEYLNDQRPLDPGLVALGDRVADIPRDRILGEPDDTIANEFLSVGYSLEHRFSETWTLRNAFRYLEDNDDIRATLSFPFIGGLNEATGTLNRVFAEQVDSNQNLALQTNVIGEFSTGSIDHTLLLGVDLARSRLDSDSFTVFFPPSVRVPINIFDPVYGARPRPDRLDAPISSERIDTNSLQFYVQDQIELLDNLILVAGFNYELFDQTTARIQGPTTTNSAQSGSAFSPRGGLVYQPLENLSLYTSYARSFFPNAALTVAGNALEPEQGDGFEVGVKAELLDRRLLTTLAYFNLTRRNVATTDPLDPRFSVATGEQRSQGLELDVIGEILPGWNLIGSYSYIDAQVTQDNQFDVGNRLPGVPKHSASLWTTYEIQSGDLQGLGFGVGVNWVGDRAGDLQNSFALDSYVLTNAAVFYERDRWRLGLNFQNIFDVNYITGTPRTRTRGIQPGEPFTVIGSISYEF